MTDFEKDEYQREISGLRALLDNNPFAQEWADGRRLTMEEAIQYALE